MRGRRIRSGTAKGKAVVCSSPLSFLGGVEPSTGRLLDPECGSAGLSVAGSVLCFPFGKGSTVGSYSMYQLKVNGVAPAAIVNQSAEPIVATGAIISEIPMVDRIDVTVIRTSDRVDVDAEQGIVELLDVDERHVVTNIIENKGRILLLQRSNSVGSYRGQWAGISGFIEPGESDEDAARRELEEETNLRSVKLSRRLEPQCFRDGDVIWCVHAFLFRVKDRSIRLDWEHQAYEWVAPEDVSKYPTVPGLQKIVCMLLAK